MKQYIGNCVIVMNKKFSSDIHFSSLDSQKLKNVLKFYQTTVNIKELYNSVDDNVLNLNLCNNYWDLPEGFTDLVLLSNLSSKEKRVLDKVGDFIKHEDKVYLLPILIVNHTKTIPSGIYSIDFIKNIAYKYKDFDISSFEKEIIHKDFDMCLCYFLDLDYSVFLEGELGFVNGIIQIGRLYESIECFSKDNEIMTYSEFIPQQSFSKKIGVNCRKQLFIKIQFLKEI